MAIVTAFASAPPGFIQLLAGEKGKEGSKERGGEGEKSENDERVEEGARRGAVKTYQRP